MPATVVRDRDIENTRAVHLAAMRQWIDQRGGLDVIDGNAGCIERRLTRKGLRTAERTLVQPRSWRDPRL
jgi:hypothetical protein